MDRPKLLKPRPEAVFLPDQIIEFEWELVPGGDGPGKLSLYIGTNPHKPYQLASVHKVWLTEWSRFNESAETLGLPPPNIYYWQISQQIVGERRTALSEVWSFSVRDYETRDRLILATRAQRMFYARGEEVTISIRMHNKSQKPVYLTFPDGQLFCAQVYFLMDFLWKEKLVWSTPLRFPFYSLAIPKNETYDNQFIWRQVGDNHQPVGPGLYEARVECTAREFSSLATAPFTIS